jgi:hypothetical protein
VVKEGRDALSNRIQPCRRDSNGFQLTRSSNHSNQYSTKTNFLNSTRRRQISTSLGDQGSQVRVPSPRAPTKSNSGKRDSIGFQLAPATCTNEGGQRDQSRALFPSMKLWLCAMPWARMAAWVAMSAPWYTAYWIRPSALSRTPGSRNPLLAVASSIAKDVRVDPHDVLEFEVKEFVAGHSEAASCSARMCRASACFSIISSVIASMRAATLSARRRRTSPAPSRSART